MPRVLNKRTGLEHDVPAGHWSLASDDYEIVNERASRAEKVADAELVPVTRAPKARPAKPKKQ